MKFCSMFSDCWLCAPETAPLPWQSPKSCLHVNQGEEASKKFNKPYKVDGPKMLHLCHAQVSQRGERSEVWSGSPFGID